MPIQHDDAREITKRLSRGQDVERLTERLAPTSAEKRPIPPGVPATRQWSADAVRQRLAFLESLGHAAPFLSGEAPDPDPESLRGNIENYIGMTRIPTGLIGPLRVNGLHASGDFYVPLATSEGALVASYDRGARIITQAGGASCMVTAEMVQRAPGFAFTRLADAARFAAWIAGEFDRLRDVAATQTRHGRLIGLRVQVQANHVYVIFDYHTGDAAGQNMVTICTAAVCEEILRTTPIPPEYWFLEANMSGDKKATSQSFMATRGRNVTAEVVLPRELVEQRLHTTPERIADYWRMSFVGGVESGSIGVSGHVANAIAAIFLACGQDVACVSEASVGVTRMETTADGSLYAAVTLPNLIVGSVGGGTRLPTAQECLSIMDCAGDDRAAKLAEITAAVALGGELSIVGALCAGEFARAHQLLGRNSPPRAVSGESEAPATG